MGHSEAQPVGEIMRKFVLEQRDDVCERHGPYRSAKAPFGNRQAWSGCPACLEETMAAEAAQANRERERVARRDSLMSGWVNADIPKRFENASFESYVAQTDAQRSVVASCREYAAEWDEVRAVGRNLILSGLYGTGKTHLAVSIARAVARRGALTMFARTYEAVQFVRESYRPGSTRSERESIGRLVDPDLLILDEVGVQGGGDNEQMILFAVLNGRYDERKPTIIVSNEAIAGIERYLTARVVDRLREGGGRILTFEWESHRGRV